MRGPLHGTGHLSIGPPVRKLRIISLLSDGQHIICWPSDKSEKKKPSQLYFTLFDKNDDLQICLRIHIDMARSLTKIHSAGVTAIEGTPRIGLIGPFIHAARSFIYPHKIWMVFP